MLDLQTGQAVAWNCNNTLCSEYGLNNVPWTSQLNLQILFTDDSSAGFNYSSFIDPVMVNNLT